MAINQNLFRQSNVNYQEVKDWLLDNGGLGGSSNDIIQFFNDVDFLQQFFSDTQFIDYLIENTDFVETLVNNINFYTALVENQNFTTLLANNENFFTTLANNETFLQTLIENPEFVTLFQQFVNDNPAIFNINSGNQILGLDGEVRGASSNNFIAKIGQRDLQQLPKPTTLNDDFDDSSINFDAWEFWLSSNKKITNGRDISLDDGTRLSVSETVKNGKGVLSLRMQTFGNARDFYMFSKQSFNFKNRKIEARFEGLRNDKIIQSDFGVFPSIVNAMDYGENTYGSFLNSDSYNFGYSLSYLNRSDQMRTEFRVHPFASNLNNTQNIKDEINAKGADLRIFRLIHNDNFGFLSSYGGEHYGWKDLEVMACPPENLPNYKMSLRIYVEPESDIIVDIQYISSTIGDDTGIEPYSVIFWNPKRNQFEYKNILDVIALAQADRS